MLKLCIYIYIYIENTTYTGKKLAHVAQHVQPSLKSIPKLCFSFILLQYVLPTSSDLVCVGLKAAHIPLDKLILIQSPRLLQNQGMSEGQLQIAVESLNPISVKWPHKRGWPPGRSCAKTLESFLLESLCRPSTESIWDAFRVRKRWATGNRRDGQLRGVNGGEW